MQTWRLAEIATPGGSRSPVVLRSENEAHAWIVVVAGSATFRAGGEQIEAPAGTLVRFEPDERHSVSSELGARLLLLLAPWPGIGHYRGAKEAGTAG